MRRDERKAQEEIEQRVRGSGINKATSKEVTKNPTRVIPDLPGEYLVFILCLVLLCYGLLFEYTFILNGKECYKWIILVMNS